MFRSKDTSIIDNLTLEKSSRKITFTISPRDFTNTDISSLDPALVNNLIQDKIQEGIQEGINHLKKKIINFI